MAYYVVLKIHELNGPTVNYPVTAFHSNYGRSYNAMTPYSSARCQGIEVTLQFPLASLSLLTDWYISNSKLSGSLDVCDTDYKDLHGKSKPFTSLRVIAEFQNARCFYMAENYDNNKRRQMTLRFDAETVKTNSIVFSHL
ncbi:MAG: hypothetical protein KBT12_02290 [Bacteroidales bacterium]|nr:hypothetical protein [Candidatus Physcousia equi]